ncbi:MAG: STAS-like domain-containing protein [Betaproteobacteria bacterium]|nr:STAS-like domain-containing protein [Betaproteobacteria bacterium]
MRISIAEEFSDAPCGRYRKNGGASGEEFREVFLAPNLKKANPSDPLIIDLNGAAGYTPSFLEEAFGGLVRNHGYTAKELEKILKIDAKNGYKLYRDVLWEFIREAAPDFTNNYGR